MAGSKRLGANSICLTRITPNKQGGAAMQVVVADAHKWTDREAQEAQSFK